MGDLSKFSDETWDKFFDFIADADESEEEVQAALDRRGINLTEARAKIRDALAAARDRDAAKLSRALDAVGRKLERDAAPPADAAEGDAAHPADFGGGCWGGAKLMPDAAEDGPPPVVKDLLWSCRASGDDASVKIAIGEWHHGIDVATFHALLAAAEKAGPGPATRWTKGVPSVAGWYWMTSPLGGCSPTYVEPDNFGNFADRMFFGPFPQPEPPR